MHEEHGCEAISGNIYEGNILTTWTAAGYYHGSRFDIHLGPMERNYEETRDRKKAGHGLLPTNRGETERMNSTLEQYLRAYVNYQQDDWKELLPMAEFAYNNGHQENTKHTPFFAKYGTNPKYQAIGHLIQGRITSPDDMSQLHDTQQAEMTEAQMRHKEYYDAQRRPDPNIQQGNMVWLLPRNIRTTRPCKKLDYKKIGPFKILARIGISAYNLDLPALMRIHNTFHISLLELYNDNKLPSQRSEPSPPIII